MVSDRWRNALHPTLEQKAQIVENAGFNNMGYTQVAALCAAEKFNEKALESVDAALRK